MSTALPPASDALPPFFRRRSVRIVPGLVLTIAIAAVATWLGSLAPLVGAPVFGILIGVVIAAFVPAGTVVDVGSRFAGKRVLQGSVILLGTGLSLTQVATVGAGSLPVMIGTLAVALLGAWAIGWLLRVDGGIRTLVGVGTGICGASAIAATTAVIGAAEADVAYAIGTIFTFNIAAVLLFPAIGHVLGLSQHAFGLWAGTAINDTSSVVAAGYTFGHAAGAYAVIVKLTRTLMIIPITLFLAFVTARRGADARPVAAEAAPAQVSSMPAQATADPATVADAGPSAMAEAASAADDEVDAHARRPARIPWGKIVPLFIIGFLAASALDTLGVIPSSWHPALASLSVFMITMALAGIGLGTRLSTIRAAGVRPLLLGGILWVLVAVSSLLLQWATGTL
jgi:uncharacterized integral membrane protein (TIGR00698 family)